MFRIENQRLFMTVLSTMATVPLMTAVDGPPRRDILTRASAMLEDCSSTFNSRIGQGTVPYGWPPLLMNKLWRFPLNHGKLFHSPLFRRRHQHSRKVIDELNKKNDGRITACASIPASPLSVLEQLKEHRCVCLFVCMYTYTLHITLYIYKDRYILYMSEFSGIRPRHGRAQVRVP